MEVIVLFCLWNSSFGRLLYFSVYETLHWGGHCIPLYEKLSIVNIIIFLFIWNSSLWWYILCSRFNEVLLETGILLVHPLIKTDRPKAQTMLKAASYLSRGHVKQIIFRKKKRCKVEFAYDFYFPILFLNLSPMLSHSVTMV